MEALGIQEFWGWKSASHWGEKVWLKIWPWKYLPSVHTGLVLYPRHTLNLYYVRLWKKRSMPRNEKWMSLYENRGGFQHKSTALHMPSIKLGVLSLPASPISWAWPSKENTILIFRLTLLTLSTPDLGNSHTELMWKTVL